MKFRVLLFGLLALAFAACDSNSPSGNGSFEAFNEDLSNPEAKSSGSNGSGSGASGNSSAYVAPDIIKDEPVVEDTTTVTEVSKLPDCGASNGGEAFMVDAEKEIYFCIGGSWVPFSTVADIFPVGCKNGTLVVDTTAVIAAAAAPPMDFSGFGALTDTVVEIRKPGAKVLGVAQKGPFRYGAEVKLLELDSVQRLMESGRTHTACITGMDGGYSFESVDLASPYLRVEASGVFRNELTGGISAEPVTLNAVVDVTERDTVNVNMLTHMEAPRVMKLVENSGNNQPIRAVKAQALREILTSFEIYLGGTGAGAGMGMGGMGGGFGGGWGFNQQQQTATTDGRFAEDIDLFDGDEYSGALLAVSIMMQRQGTGSGMAQYTSGIAERIKGNGNWDDNNAKADLADWLMVLDTSGTYEFIRNNIASWNMGEVPDFEQHLRNFWTKIYQFETCNATTAGTVRHINNSLSKFFISYYEQPDGPRIRFICDAETHNWRPATDIEKDTVGLLGEYDGQIRAGKINTDKNYVFQEKSKTWRAATSDDIQEFVDIKDVYDNLAPDETVFFILRHAERTDDTGKKGHLTDNGKKQSQQVGAKIKGEEAFFAYSGYTRTQETCDNIAIGMGQSGASVELMESLDGTWYVKDDDKLESYKSADGGLWFVTSRYAYRGMYADAHYDLETRSKEFVSEKLIAKAGSMKRINVLVSHDQFVMPFVTYCTQGRANLRYFDNQNWINYLAGVAVIMDASKNVRYVPVRGLDSGIMH